MKADRPYTLQPHELRAQARAAPPAGSDSLPAEKRPQTRAECVHGPRPCPWLGCRYHLWLDVHPDAGSVKVNRPDALAWILGDAPGPVPECESCALDVADHGRTSGCGCSLEEIGDLLLISRERVRQVEEGLLRALQIVEWDR